MTKQEIEVKECNSNYVILADWTTRAGYRSIVIENFMTFNCGYVGIPKFHPLYGKRYDEHCKFLIPFKDLVKEFIKNNMIGKRSVVPLFLWDGKTASMNMVFNVHGGITYSRTNKEYPVKSDLHFIGFDCAHAFDTANKCDLEYCINECENLAEQLKLVE